MKHWGKGSEYDQNIVGVIKDISVDDAIVMIRDKVRGRLPSGPSELRRTFQFFDRDGSGQIDFEEMEATLRVQCGLKFEDSLLQAIIARFDPDGVGPCPARSEHPTMLLCSPCGVAGVARRD